MNAEDFMSAGKDHPSKDFTTRLMQEIQKEDQALESVLRKHGSMQTSESFVANFQAQLVSERLKKPIRPLFSTKAWVFVAMVVIGLFTLPFLFESSPGSTASSSEWSLLTHQTSDLFQHYLTPYLVLPTVFLFLLAALGYRRKIKL